MKTLQTELHPKPWIWLKVLSYGIWVASYSTQGIIIEFQLPLAKDALETIIKMTEIFHQ